MTVAESVSVKEVCRRSGAYPQYIYTLIATGKLSGHKDADGHWSISLTSFESWLESREKRKAGVYA